MLDCLSSSPSSCKYCIFPTKWSKLENHMDPSKSNFFVLVMIPRSQLNMLVFSFQCFVCTLEDLAYSYQKLLSKLSNFVKYKHKTYFD